jgi:transposase
LSTSKTIEVKNLDHLGIIAGLIDEIGIVEIINEKLGIDKREKISSGQVVKAMILNGLGFVSKPLYLFSKFFEDKGMEKLLGGSVKSDYLNDDKLGRVMDELYKYRKLKLFKFSQVQLNKEIIKSGQTVYKITAVRLNSALVLPLNPQH